jgi:chemotaxis response regulator CheB
MIKVIIFNDSPVIHQQLIDVLVEVNGIKIFEVEGNIKEMVESIQKKHPNVLMLDVPIFSKN